VRTQAQLESSVAHLNQVLEEKNPSHYYVLSPITGTDNHSLWLAGPHGDTKICTSDSDTMYHSLVALRHAHQVI
jgi:hypothetical protein